MSGSAPSTTFPTSLVPTTATGSATATIQYNGTDGTTALVGAARQGTITVKWAPKAATEVTLVAPASITTAAAYASGAVSGWTYTVTYNDGSEKGTSDFSPALTINWWNGQGEEPDGNYLICAEAAEIKNFVEGNRYNLTITGKVEGVEVNQTVTVLVDNN